MDPTLELFIVGIALVITIVLICAILRIFTIEKHLARLVELAEQGSVSKSTQSGASFETTSVPAFRSL